jgi:hypothetical protein
VIDTLLAPVAVATANVVRLKSLSSLLMSRNPLLTGTVPTELGLLSELQRLDIQITGLRGTVPGEVCALRNPGTLRLNTLKADCSPISSGETPMVCPRECCSRCCDHETEECFDVVS